MAVNIVNVGFKGIYPSSTADRTGYVSDLDENDIFYFLGTDYGTTAWSNPSGGAHLTTTLSNAWSNANDPSRLTDNSTAAGVSELANDGLTVTFQFLTCNIQPTRIDLASSWNLSTNGVNWKAEASNNGTNWIDISTTENVPFPGGGNQVYNFTLQNIDTYYSYIRIRVSSSNTNSTDVYHTEVKIYGNLFRTDGGEAGQVSPITTLESLPKFIPESTGVQDGDLLYYNNGVVTNQRNTFYETDRLVMTGNLALSDNHFPNFYILDPNGSTRTVTLPPTPLTNQFFRLKTLDPNFAITIDDSGTVTTLNTSTLVVDLYWDGTEWTAINFG